MSHLHYGRHELGQNFLTDPRVIRHITKLASQTTGPLIEWGTGDGAITVSLARLGRPVQGIEIDPRRARLLDRRTGPHVCISEGDILRHAPPIDATVVSNIPFHLTTPILRHLLESPGWTQAILITQWEVARKRAGVGGTTQMTAQWWPWFTFTLDQRIPAAAFAPRPSVDAGLLLIARRTTPLLEIGDRARYQAWVANVFSSRGRGLREILARTGLSPAAAKDFTERYGLQTHGLPRDLDERQWAGAFQLRADPGPHGRRASRPPRQSP